jgi:tRNA (cmo5U34)-methyltransferase
MAQLTSLEPDASPALDRLYQHAHAHAPEGFAFDRNVCAVFDDMVARSVPQYQATQQLIAELALQYLSPAELAAPAGAAPTRPAPHAALLEAESSTAPASIVDLGCSTGNSLSALLARTTHPLSYVGVDSSEEMLALCRNKAQGFSPEHHVNLVRADVTQLKRLPAPRPRVALMVLVLQFIRPFERPRVVRMVHRSLEPGGCLILLEKTLEEHAELNGTFIALHHAHKRAAGYSELEIAKKREALENRLIPCFPRENLALLKEAGFRHVTTFFQWLNFQGYLAVKA